MIVVFVVDTSPSMAAAANSSGGDRGTGVIGKHIFFYVEVCDMYVIYIYVYPLEADNMYVILCYSLLSSSIYY